MSAKTPFRLYGSQGNGKTYVTTSPSKPLAIYQDWLKENELLSDGDETPSFQYRPTMELRWRGKVLEQKWIISEMAYTHKWVPVRKRDKREPT
jgi:hypothetical protein